MDFEPWWLIFLPLVFALGWIASRVDFRQMLLETRSLPRSYFQGLNFLLNEEPDRAIDAFVEVAKLDPETTELHFALGSLFRRRGEVERAIRVHQSLLARADLPATDREMAQYELAQDFLKAGMLDRAETAFERVVDTRYAVPAVRALIRIHEQEHDWPSAIAAVRRLHALVDEPVPQLAHYQCELAEAALAQQPPDLSAASDALDAAEHAAQDMRRRAVPEQDGSAALARVMMLRARLAKLTGDTARETQYLLMVLEDTPAYGALVAADLCDSLCRSGREDEAIDILRRHYWKHPSLDVFNVLFRHLRAAGQGTQQAWAFAREALRAHPSLLGLERVLDAEVASREQGGEAEPVRLQEATALDEANRSDLELLRLLIRRHAQRLDRHACRNCGFEARRFYWQCPGCTSWETYTPRRLEEDR